MKIHLDYTDTRIDNALIKISGSKSESNRLLILQQFFKNIQLENLSDSDDTRHLQHALSTTDTLIDIGHAGTAMRFLTAYFACATNREVVLTGSERMQNRPIKILVDALRFLGATIEYVDKEGYPPLKISGKRLDKNSVSIQGNVSSQYISALLLIAPSLEKGLSLNLLGEVTSRPYLEMTLALLNQIGIKTVWEENRILIEPSSNSVTTNVVVESDWSSASYYYSLVAMSEIGTSVTLSSYKKDSLQGDSRLAQLYTFFGVETSYSEGSIHLIKSNEIAIEGTLSFEADLINAPDIAQTISVTCFGLGIACNLTGLHTLKIKETDRLVALRNELQKLGAEIRITQDSLHLEPSVKINENIAIETYNDHRMAMAFAPLALKVPITINDAEVVTKSYISYWEDLEACVQ